MKITVGKLAECFAFLPSLNLSWIRTSIGTIYFLQFGWLYWYIQVQQDFYKKKQQYYSEKFHCKFRDCEVTYRKTCKNCIVASVDEDGDFYCPYYKKSKDYEQ